MEEEEFLEVYLKTQRVKCELMPEDTRFLNGKRVLIIGGCGSNARSMSQILVEKNLFKSVILADIAENGLL